MPRFKLQVSKNQKKYNVVVQSSTPKEAREKFHREWYSVLNIEEFDEKLQSKDRFYFTVENNGGIKSGSTFWDDVFKIYLKLRRDLWYKVLELYKNKEESEEKKQDLLKNLEEAYQIHEKNESKSQSKIDKKNNKKKEQVEETIDDFYMKKELETTYKLIEFVIAKIESVLNSKNLWKIDEERRWKIEQVYHNIIQIKNSTNTSKLKEIWELALLRIGQVELELVEKEKNIYAKEFLKETNKLLKKIGSDKHFIEKDKDIKLQVEIFLKKSKVWLKSVKKSLKPQKRKPVDTSSYDYLKTVALLNRYKERNRQVHIQILKNFWEFFNPRSKENFSKLLLTRAVLRQNIIIMKAKKSWKIYSYTKLVKWYEKLFEGLQYVIKWMNKYLFAVVAIFSTTFLFIISINYFFSWDISSISFNYYGLYTIILIIIFSLLSRIIRWFWTFGLSISLFFIINIFARVNFAGAIF